MIGYFGKLPGNADFISYRASSEDVQVFDECLQAAMRRLMESERWEEHFDAMPSCSFLFRASAQHWLVGELASANDASGRRYPLMVFQRVQAWVGEQPFYAPWTACEVVARQMSEPMQEAIHRHHDATLFELRIKALRAADESDLRLHQRLHDRVLDQWRLSGVSDAISRGYPEFIANAVMHRMIGLRQRCERGPLPPVVLPLPAEQALLRPMADIWSHWLTLIAQAPPTLMLLVHDALRPKLLAFSSGDTARMYRVLAGVEARSARYDVLEPFERFDPALAQLPLPDPQCSIRDCMAHYTARDKHALGHQ